MVSSIILCICAVNAHGVLNNHDLVNVSTEDVAMANVGQFDTSTDSNVINNICAGDKVMKVWTSVGHLADIGLRHFIGSLACTTNHPLSSDFTNFKFPPIETGDLMSSR